ncbi:MAG: hypothetical protein KJP26_11200 [Maribacter sp.]|nr:hypothetical protein [Maribacter sp.]
MKLIDTYLPNFQFREHLSTLVSASPSRAYDAMRSFDFSRSWMIRTIFSTRELLFGVSSRQNRKNNTGVFGPLLESTLNLGWSILEEVPNRELVVGAVTQPWLAKVNFEGLPGPEFINFTKPGFAKIIWNIEVSEIKPNLTFLATETRVALTDHNSRRKFRIYWFLFSPGIRLIRWLAFRIIKRDIKNDPGSFN